MSINNQGMNWIRQDKRLAIYLRDGLACAYCSHSVEDGARLTLDHVDAYANGGKHHETNLVTACERCNWGKNDRPMDDWVIAVCEYINHGMTPDSIMEHIDATTHKPLHEFRQQAKAMIEARGSAARVIRRMRRDAKRGRVMQ
jgi:hypothetical protein